jgi:hypothetical protein
MLEEIAKKYDITEKSLRFLIRRGIIQEVPTLTRPPSVYHSESRI